MPFAVFFLLCSLRGTGTWGGSESSPSHQQPPPSSAASPAPPFLPGLCCCPSPDAADTEQPQPPAGSPPSPSVHILLRAALPGQLQLLDTPALLGDARKKMETPSSCLPEPFPAFQHRAEELGPVKATWSSCTVVGGCFWGEVLVGKRLMRNGCLELTLEAMGSFLVCVCVHLQ